MANPTYTLSVAQKLVFRAVVDLYQPVPVSVDPVTKKQARPSFPDSATWTNVPCRYKATQDFEEQGYGALLGQMTENNIMTQDRFHFHLSQDIGANWKIVMKSSEFPISGQFWITQGEDQEVIEYGLRGILFSYREIYGKRGV